MSTFKIFNPLEDHNSFYAFPSLMKSIKDGDFKRFTDFVCMNISNDFIVENFPNRLDSQVDSYFNSNPKDELPGIIQNYLSPIMHFVDNEQLFWKSLIQTGNLKLDHVENDKYESISDTSPVYVGKIESQWVHVEDSEDSILNLDFTIPSFKGKMEDFEWESNETTNYNTSTSVTPPSISQEEENESIIPAVIYESGDWETFNQFNPGSTISEIDGVTEVDGLKLDVDKFSNTDQDIEFNAILIYFENENGRELGGIMFFGKNSTEDFIKNSTKKFSDYFSTTLQIKVSTSLETYQTVNRIPRQLDLDRFYKSLQDMENSGISNVIYSLDSTLGGISKKLEHIWDVILTDKSKIPTTLNERLLTLENGETRQTPIYRFDSPSETWVVSHGLNGFPGVTIVNDEGETILSHVKYITANVIEVNFSTPETGFIVLDSYHNYEREYEDGSIENEKFSELNEEITSFLSQINTINPNNPGDVESALLKLDELRSKIDKLETGEFLPMQL